MIKRNSFSLSRGDLDLLKHARNFLSGEFLNKAVAFFAIPVITRLITPEEYGILMVFNGLVAILTVFASLNIYTAVGRYYFEDELCDFRQFMSSVTVFSLIFGSLFLIGAVFVESKIVEQYLAVDHMVLIYSAAIALELAILRIYLKYLQVRSLSKAYTLLAAFRGSLVLGLSIILIILLEEEKYFGRIYGQFAILLLLAIFAFIRIWKLSKLHFSWKHIRYGLNLSVPLIPHALSLIILAESDRFIINSISGNYSAGIYGFSYQIAMLLGMVITSFNLPGHRNFTKFCRIGIVQSS